MPVFIIGTSLPYSHVMSCLHTSQSTGQWIVSLESLRSMLLARGGAIQPDLIRRHRNIVTELGLIHPPLGLNIFVIERIAPDIPLRDVVCGVLPFVVLMIFAVVVL